MSAYLIRFGRKFNHLNNSKLGFSYLRISCLLRRWKSDGKSVETASVGNDDEEIDKPIQYTSSKAHQEWKAAYNFRVPEEKDPYPSYQWPVIVASFLAVLIYFCSLREENDIDENLSKPLFERFPNLEKPMLEQTINNYKATGKDTTELEKRLKEITGKL